MELNEPFIPTSFTGIGQVREFLLNPERESELFAAIAHGVPLTEAAEAINVRYSDLYRIVTSEYREQYLAAREAHANILAESNLDLADKVVLREVPADVASAAVKIRQWHMERSAPEAYGQKSTVNMNIKQVAELHLSAIRKLANTPIEGEYEVKEETSPEGSADSLENHPLL